MAQSVKNLMFKHKDLCLNPAKNKVRTGDGSVVRAVTLTERRSGFGSQYPLGTTVTCTPVSGDPLSSANL